MRQLASANLILVPASQLPFKVEWRRIADRLPAGDALFVVPDGETPLRRSMRVIAVQLQRRGHRIAAFSPTVLRARS